MYLIINIDCTEIIYSSDDFQEIDYMFRKLNGSKKNYYIYWLDFSKMIIEEEEI